MLALPLMEFQFNIGSFGSLQNYQLEAVTIRGSKLTAAILWCKGTLQNLA